MSRRQICLQTVHAMRYISTRGQSPALSFSDILLGGLAPDGGLYLPESYPQIGRAELDAWRHLGYAELAFEILSRFIDDIPAEDLRALCERTYTPAVYCHTRAGDDAADITPVKWLEPGRLALLELSNGPTLAFKDMAMQLLGNLFSTCWTSVMIRSTSLVRLPAIPVRQPSMRCAASTVCRCSCSRRMVV